MTEAQSNVRRPHRGCRCLERTFFCGRSSSRGNGLKESFQEPCSFSCNHTLRIISSIGSCLDGIKKMLRKPLADFNAQEKAKSVRRCVASSHTPDARASHAFVD
jgi:hypothetical protein